MLRYLLVECAHHTLSPRGADADLKRWGLEPAKRGGKNANKRAAVAVARKLSALLLRLWVTGEVHAGLRRSQERGPALRGGRRRRLRGLRRLPLGVPDALHPHGGHRDHAHHLGPYLRAFRLSALPHSVHDRGPPGRGRGPVRPAGGLLRPLRGLQAGRHRRASRRDRPLGVSGLQGRLRGHLEAAGAIRQPRSPDEVDTAVVLLDREKTLQWQTKEVA